MKIRAEVSRLERQAARLNRELIAIIDRREDGAYIALGSISPEFEQLSADELEALRLERGEALLVVAVEKPENAPLP